MNIKKLSVKITNLIILSALTFALAGGNVLSVYAEKSDEEYLSEAEARKDMPIQSDDYVNWPAGPKLGCESAMLIEANTGVVLYEKNIHEKLYPASVTKMLTALIAMEECDMDEMVTYSQAAIDSINWRTDANLGIAPGNQITMEQSLYGLLVGSANEVAYAIAEHISGEGNIAGFADKMNEKAKALGCTDSHFVTPNGIHDEDHYTSAADLAKIAEAFYSYELLAKMASTVKYQVPQTATQPREDMIVYAKSKLHSGKEYAYEGLVGTKTGYTEFARQTLVSCAEKNGIRLIAVVLKEESPYQFTDTVELFDYGFNNFKKVSAAENDTTYVIQSLTFFKASADVFGSSKPILQMNSSDYIILPIDAGFEEVTSKLDYADRKKGDIAKINYYYNDKYVGCAAIEPATAPIKNFDFGPLEIETTKEAPEEDVMFINVKNIIIGVAIITVLLIIIFAIRSLVLAKTGRGMRRRRRPARKSYRTPSTRDLDWRGFK